MLQLCCATAQFIASYLRTHLLCAALTLTLLFQTTTYALCSPAFSVVRSTSVRCTQIDLHLEIMLGLQKV